MMDKYVELTLLEGNFETQGFPIHIQIFSKGTFSKKRLCNKLGYLPPYPEMPLLLCQWQRDFWDTFGMEYECPSDKRTQFSCNDSANKLEIAINKWLNCANNQKEWLGIRDDLNKYLPDNGSNLVVIHTENKLLRSLPFIAWDLFRQKKVEIVLGMSGESKKTKRAKNKVLAISGQDKNIDFKKDTDKLEKDFFNLQDVTSLQAPTKQKFYEYLTDKKGWRVLFFAGHGNPNGCFDVNKNESICVNESFFAFSKAIEQGMEVSIFNSCNGLNTAIQLADIGLPDSIIMREPISNKAANTFLETFLKSYIKEKKSIYLSVQDARFSLEPFNREHPGIIWIPMLCQKLTVKQPNWFELLIKGLTRTAIIILVFFIFIVGAMYLDEKFDNEEEMIKFQNKLTKETQDKITVLQKKIETLQSIEDKYSPKINQHITEIKSEFENKLEAGRKIAQKKYIESQNKIVEQNRIIEELSKKVNKYKINNDVKHDIELKHNLTLLRIENKVSQYSKNQADTQGYLIFEPDVFIKINGVRETDLQKIGSQSIINLDKKFIFDETIQIEVWISERDGSHIYLETLNIKSELIGKNEQNKIIIGSKIPNFLEGKGIKSYPMKYQWHYVLYYKVESVFHK